jgi:hypothetical protein
LSLNQAAGQDVRVVGSYTIDPAANFKSSPVSFCVTQEEIFLFPDIDSGTIKIFGKSGKNLKLIDTLGGNGLGKETFGQIRFCNYSRNENMLALIDSTARKLIILKRMGLVGFVPFKAFNCKNLGYDMGFAGENNRLIISGYVTDKEGQPFDLYSINIETGQIDYLLPSHEKYGLKTREDYEEEYFKKQTLPAIGINAYFDIQGDKLYFVWEGAIRIIKLDLRSRGKAVFGQEGSYFTRPDAYRLTKSYLREDYATNLNERQKRAYVKNIFATPAYVFLIYATPGNSTLRLQTYTTEGRFLCDTLIPVNAGQKPGQAMWLDKDSNDLYAFSTAGEGTTNAGFSLLKYKIISR